MSTYPYWTNHISNSWYHATFTDTYNSQQSWSSTPWGTNESARHADLEHQPSYVKFWASSYVFHITLVIAIRDRGPNTTTASTGKSLLEGLERRHWQASWEQNCQRTTICSEYQSVKHNHPKVTGITIQILAAKKPRRSWEIKLYSGRKTSKWILK
jgi:hypothetical protein